MLTVDIKLINFGIKLMLHVEISLTIQFDDSLMLPNLVNVYEINARKVIFLCISIHNGFLQKWNLEYDFSFNTYYYNQLY